MRSAWFERQISSAIYEPSTNIMPWNVANIAAGFDTTAFKFLDARNLLSWSDVDASAINQAKQHLPTFMAATSKKYQIVDCDLDQPGRVADWLQGLSRSNQNLLIVMQGISMYLNKDLMQLLLGTIHQATQSSSEVRILIDWCSPVLNRFGRLHPAFLQARIFSVQLDWALRDLRDITRLLPGFEHVTTEDTIYGQTSISTRFCKFLYERVLRPNSPGIYGCSVFRRRSVD